VRQWVLRLGMLQAQQLHKWSRQLLKMKKGSSHVV
jgi:hypothetical protein